MCLTFFLLVPAVLGVVRANMVVELAISALFAVSLNLLLSYTGLFSLGHALFFGTGAYATALALRHVEGLGLLSAILAGALAAGLVALICCPLLVRVSGTAFTMLTLAFGQLMYVVCLKFREVTGGEDGIAGFPVPPLEIPGVFSLDMTVPAHFYYFALLVCAAGIWLMWFLTRTPFGSVMTGIRDNPERVGYLGYKVAQSKAVVFIISGCFAGIAGSVFALFHNLVSTDGVLHLMVSFIPLVAILVGGIGSFAGPILGSGILLLIEEWSVRLTDRVELVTGLIFVLVVLLAPKGVVGLSRSFGKRWHQRQHRPLSEGEAP
jgi:branched-chain amino acid transport system permease protein